MRCQVFAKEDQACLLRRRLRVSKHMLRAVCWRVQQQPVVQCYNGPCRGGAKGRAVEMLYQSCPVGSPEARCFKEPCQVDGETQKHNNNFPKQPVAYYLSGKCLRCQGRDLCIDLLHALLSVCSPSSSYLILYFCPFDLSLRLIPVTGICSAAWFDVNGNLLSDKSCGLNDTVQ